MQELKPVNIILYAVLSFITFGLFYFYWQYKQMKQVQILLNKSNSGFFLWFILNILTFGLFHIYHEYSSTKEVLYIQKIYQVEEMEEYFPLVAGVLSFFGVFLLVDIIQQVEVNNIIEQIQKNKLQLRSR